MLYLTRPDLPRRARARRVRGQITRFFLRGGDAFSLEKLEALARA